MYTRLFCFALCILPASGSADWTLGRDGESCTAACSHIGQVCSEHALMLRDGEANSKEEIGELIKVLNGNCKKYSEQYGLKSDVPVYKASTGECYVSAPHREEKHFDCTRSAPIGKQRLCWCHSESETMPASFKKGSADLDDTGDDGNEGLSMALIIWIISGNMLFLGLVGMCFGIVRRYVKKGSSSVNEAGKKRPADNGFYVRCPECGCPLGESRSLGAVSYQVTQSRAFRAGENSRDSQGTPPCSPKATLGSALRSASSQSKPTRSLGFSTSSNDSMTSVAEEEVEQMQDAV